MGRAIDLFVTYRFIKLLVTPFEKTDAFKLGIIDKDGNRVIPPKPKTGPWDKRPKSLNTSEERNSYSSSQTCIQHQKTFRKSAWT